MSLYIGGTIAMAIFGMFFLWVPSSDGQEHKNLVLSALCITRMSFVIVYVMFAIAFSIQVFQAYGINYLFVFELDPQHKVTHTTMYRVSCLMLFIWTACMAFTLAELKLEFIFEHKPAIFMVVLLFAFILFCLQPFFKCGYRTARYQLMITLFEISKAPFGRVRFRDFFFADIITSLVATLQDIGSSLYFVTSPGFEDHSFNGKSSRTLTTYLMICAIFPFWFRFW